MLDQMTNRLKAQVNLEGVLATVLNDVVALHGAEYGAIQLLEKQTLWVVGERNLGPDFISAFAQVTQEDVSACGRALRQKRPIVIADVVQDRDFQPFLPVLKKLGFRAVQSTPLITEGGECVGVVTTQFAHPHQPTAIEMSTIVSYSFIAAEYIKRFMRPADPRRLHDELMINSKSTQDTDGRLASSSALM